MNQSTTGHTVIRSGPETALPDFHTLGVTGSIDLLTSGLRASGTVIEWQTPHHGMEIDLRAVLLLYRAADDILTSVLASGDATRVLIRLAAVHQGIRLTIEDNAGSPPEPQEALRTAVKLFGGTVASGSVPVPISAAGLRNQVRITLPLA